MQMKAVTIALPLVDSLLLHTVVAALVLMLPIYSGSAGQRSFISYLVYLTNGEGSAPSHNVSGGEKHVDVGQARAQAKPGPQKAARQRKKAEVEKIGKTPEKNAPPGQREEAAPGAVPPAVGALQNIPPKTEEVKANAEKVEEVPKEPAETSGGQEVKEGAVSSSQETAGALQNIPPKTDVVKAHTEMAEEVAKELPEAEGDQATEEGGVSSSQETASALQNIPPKTDVVKAHTEMAEEVAKEPAETSGGQEVKAGAVSSSQETASALQNIPPKTDVVKAHTEMAEEVAKEPAETSGGQEVKAGAVSSSQETASALQDVPPKTDAVKADAEKAEEVAKEPERTRGKQEVKKGAVSSAREAASALQDVPPKTDAVKAKTEKAKKVAREPERTRGHQEVKKGAVSSARTTSALLPESSVQSRPAGISLTAPVAEQFMARLLPDTETLLHYHGGSKAEAHEVAVGREMPVSESGSEATGPGEVGAAPGETDNPAVAERQETTPQNEAPEGAAAEQTRAGVTVPTSQSAPAAGTPEPPAEVRQVAEGAPSPAMARREKAGVTPRAKQQQTANEEKQAPIGISGAAALLPRDIIIRVAVTGEGGSFVFTRLSRRSYPSADRENVGGKDNPVKADEESGPAGGAPAKRVLSVVNADKGIYTLVIGNTGGKTCVVNAVFLLFERTKKERTKEYKEIQLAPGTGVKFKFLVPDAIFWDDDGRFTGSIEDSESITKFNSETGLVWREVKDD
jgi:hypothetical protein